MNKIEELDGDKLIIQDTVETISDRMNEESEKVEQLVNGIMISPKILIRFR